MATNPKQPSNPLASAFPMLFKRTGEVKRHPKAGRFTRKVSIMASRRAPALMAARSITIETTFGLMVLTPAITEMIKAEDGTIEALLINGWEVYVTTPENEAILPIPLTQSELTEMEG